MDANARIFVAGSRTFVGRAIVARLHAEAFTNVVGTGDARARPDGSGGRQSLLRRRQARVHVRNRRRAGRDRWQREAPRRSDDRQPARGRQRDSRRAASSRAETRLSRQLVHLSEAGGAAVQSGYALDRTGGADERRLRHGEARRCEARGRRAAASTGRRSFRRSRPTRTAPATTSAPRTRTLARG